jgi:hypothetical protein
MSSDQIVRKPLRVRERSRRTLDERLSLRFSRDGRVIQQRDFLDHAEALEAVGLRGSSRGEIR